MPRALVTMWALLGGACGFDSTGTAAGALDGSPDAPIDAAYVAPTHLLLTEVKTRAQNYEDFVELWNPTGEVVALDDYYLTDSAIYPTLPQLVAAGPLPVLDHTDFVVRFPAGARIASGGVEVVAIDEAGFVIAFGGTPTYAIRSVTTAAAMINLFNTNQPRISDTGEGVVLFRWDGQRDLVTDVDMVMAANTPIAANLLADKTGVSVDGPDADTIASTYQPDAASVPPFAVRTPLSYQRIALEGDHEVQAGGNGVGGHDETSEDTRATWEQTDFTPPSPGTIPATLLP